MKNVKHIISMSGMSADPRHMPPLHLSVVMPLLYSAMHLTCMVQKVAALLRNLLRCSLFCAAATIMAGSIRSGGTRLSCAVMTHMHQPYRVSDWKAMAKAECSVTQAVTAKAALSTLGLAVACVLQLMAVLLWHLLGQCMAG